MCTSKILTDLCAIKQSVKIKNSFADIANNVLVVKKLTEHIEVFLKISGKQTVKLRSGSIKFKNYFKQLTVPFKIYTDFECDVKRIKCSDRGENASYNDEKDQDHIPRSSAYKVVCAEDKFSKPVVVYRGENKVYKFIDAILKEYDRSRDMTK